MSNEIIGIIGTVIILIGFLTAGEKKIRLFNVIGSVFFIVYGFLINAYSTIILNITLIAVNVIKLLQAKEV